MRGRKPEPKYKAYLGCDPGALGGMSLIVPRPDGDEYDFFPWPKSKDLQKVYHQLRVWARQYDRKIFCHLEKVWAVRGQGVTSCFSFGENYGCWKMALTSVGIKFELIPARTWQTTLKITPEDGRDSKERSYNTASRLFPEVSFITPRGRIMDEKTDSILIAHTARLAQELR